MISAQITGLEQLTDRLRDLPRALQRRVVRKAARGAMLPVREAAKANAKRIDDPTTREKVWRNVVLQEATKAGRRAGGVVMRVGIRGGASSNQHSSDASSNPGGDTRHWRYIEFGANGSPAVPFMRPALAQNIELVKTRFADTFRAELEKL